MSKNEYSDERGRNFSFVQKLENLPEDWERIIHEKCVPMAYIVHDKDTYTQYEIDNNPALAGKIAGELKDAHVHFFVYFNGKRTIGGVVKMFSELNIGYAELVVSKNGKLAYFLHIGCEDKYQYPYEDLKVIHGLKVDYAALNNVNFADVLDFAHEHGIRKFSALVQATKRTDPPLFKYVCGHYALVCAYFAGVREG